MTLLELIIVCAILMVLASAAMPMARFTIKRQKETELHRELREMRDAIDRYKDAADRNLIRVEAGTEGYPPDLETLVKGVDIAAQANAGVPAAALGGGAAGAGFGAGGTTTGQGASGFGFSGAGGGTSGSNPSGGQAGGISGGLPGGLSGATGLGSGQTGRAGTTSGGAADATRHVRFLRKVPTDPMTGRAEWGMRSVQDDPTSSSWGGKNVFDVFSLSSGTALDGTKYSDW